MILNVFFALLIAAFLMPFIWELIKRLIRFADNLAFLATIILDAVLAGVVLWLYGMFSLWALVGATILVWIVARATYNDFIKRFFPGKVSM